jgi:hypothetical protein
MPPPRREGIGEAMQHAARPDEIEAEAQHVERENVGDRIADIAEANLAGLARGITEAHGAGRARGRLTGERQGWPQDAQRRTGYDPDAGRLALCGESGIASPEPRRGCGRSGRGSGSSASVTLRESDHRP